MDTDVRLSYEHISQVCTQSKYTLNELEQILFNEVLPALRVNLIYVIGSIWQGFDTDWLVQRVLAKHRFGKSRPLILRRYTQDHWHELMPLIQKQRAFMNDH